MEKYYEFAKQLCLDCEEIFIDGFYKDKSTTAKDVADFVTEYDYMIEEKIKNKIFDNYSTHRFIGEESVADGDKCELTDEYTWILDPIDGTSNFIAKFPMCCISIGLFYKKEAIVGVVYNPITKELFSAMKNSGAFLNNIQLSARNNKSIRECLVISGWGSDRNSVNVLTKTANLRRIYDECLGLRSLGSAAMSLCYVAAGRGDVYIEQAIKCWDMAAGALIVQEAGGVIRDLNGKQFDVMTHGIICASNESLVRHIATLIDIIDY